MRARRALAALLLVAAGLAGADATRVLEGRVVGIKDGDSFEMRSGAGLVEVRIAYVDTPERDQPWADRSRQALAQRIARRDVIVHQVDVDAYGRVVGEVYASNVCVGCELVRDGHAWVYRKYAHDPVLFELEAQARDAQRGLWSLPEAQRTPPWEWRAAQREREPARAKSRCDPPPSCARVASCDEARRLLAQCGPVGLDGDGDGVPCERTCSR